MGGRKIAKRKQNFLFIGKTSLFLIKFPQNEDITCWRMLTIGGYITKLKKGKKKEKRNCCSQAVVVVGWWPLQDNLESMKV